MASLAPFIAEEYQSLDFDELAEAPVEALAGISSEDAAALKRAFGIRTIGDLARNKYVAAAVAIVGLASNAKTDAGAASGLSSVTIPDAADPFANAKRRGEEARAFLLQAGGAPLDEAEVAELLATTEPDIAAKRRSDMLIGLPVADGRYLYPRWQFDIPGRAVVRDLPVVLAALEVQDPWMRAAFFLRPNTRLQDLRPIDALLTGDVARVRTAAGAYGEQGAA
ncbi:MAG: hypothetical protein HYX51_11585 [Chloroflexi bacterium]|nr:hypothetical protein [Chloroflexota bacterium]